MHEGGLLRPITRKLSFLAFLITTNSPSFKGLFKLSSVRIERIDKHGIETYKLEEVIERPNLAS